MARIGIYGGTFNPPHIGHIRAAQHAVQALGLDELLLIPDRIAPHKVIPSGTANPQQRLEMVRLAAKGLDKAQVLDLELRRDGPSYTYQTMEELKQQYPHDELILLMGTDMFLSFLTWKNPEIILSHAALGVFYRGDRGEVEQIHGMKSRLEADGHTVYLVENPVVDISSTDLRRMLALHCAGPFLPDGVADYIRRHGLYETWTDWKNLSIEELEAVVIRLLNPKRVAHVLGCRDAAVSLARRWGANETDAARAALLHDITKALDGPLQLTLCSEYGIILDDFSRKYPKTLHALTGGYVAQRIFGENQEVVDAIFSHTTGKRDMNTLQMIIYIADYMEPNRDFPGVEDLRKAAYEDLHKAMELGLHMTLQHLARQGNEVSPASQEALEWLKQNVK
jgi:nicotinate-nucleotide adenylyltransferase